MALILSLETSTDVCSVALHDNGVLLQEVVIPEPQAQAEKLAPTIKKIFESSSMSFNDLKAVAITAGPGSYTGLRIGTSTAKGICFAREIPLIVIPTLELLAFQALEFVRNDALLCPMIDARRMEVYTQLFDLELRPIGDLEARIINNESYAELLAAGKVFFFGNGASKCRSVIHNPNAVFLDNIIPLASALGVLAKKKFMDSIFEDLQEFKPLYLKEFVAKKAQPLLR